MEPFISAGIDVSDKSSHEWLHHANLSVGELRARWLAPTGKGILNALVAERFARTALSRFVGKFGGKYDLRGIPLAGQNLSRIDFSGVDLFAADLSRADFTAADLSHSFLSESDIRGTRFHWVHLDGAYLDNVVFDNDTSFLGVDLNSVNFTLATLLHDLALSQQRIQQLERRHPIFAFFLRWTCDYGRSFSRYAVWVVAFITAYACAYWRFPSLLSTTHRSVLDYLYFSVVTFATVGYGDITPASELGRLVVISEICVAYLMGGLLVAIFARRVIG